MTRETKRGEFTADADEVKRGFIVFNLENAKWTDSEKKACCWAEGRGVLRAGPMGKG